MHHEVELIVALGSGGRNIPEEKARGAILGYGVGLDMTLRDVQSVAKKKGLPWTVAKGFDTSAPLSEIIPADPALPVPVFGIYCRINGDERQRAETSEMIFSVPFLVHYLSTIFTLERGDLIFTGTPAGVGVVNPGETIEAGIDGLVSIKHQVTAP
jgi:2-keto-4-pentenoate hydratase/2-oxohepta-3-ene-1,7-dioic acid hydratase in catechol pathway